MHTGAPRLYTAQNGSRSVNKGWYRVKRGLRKRDWTGPWRKCFGLVDEGEEGAKAEIADTLLFAGKATSYALRSTWV